MPSCVPAAVPWQQAFTQPMVSCASTHPCMPVYRTVKVSKKPPNYKVLLRESWGQLTVLTLTLVNCIQPESPVLQITTPSTSVNTLSRF